MHCPCGSQLLIDDCCLPIIEHKKVASSPEHLMRSRYTAYTLKNAKYIYDTYAEKNRNQQSIPDIQDWADQTKWLKLTILHSSSFPNLSTDKNTKYAKINDDMPTVTFSASYIFENKLFTMTEQSRFTIENNQWHYVDGEYSSDDGEKLPNRNSNCPCGSTKKFKRCCGK